VWSNFLTTVQRLKHVSVPCHRPINLMAAQWRSLVPPNTRSAGTGNCERAGALVGCRKAESREDWRQDSRCLWWIAVTSKDVLRTAKMVYARRSKRREPLLDRIKEKISYAILKVLFNYSNSHRMWQVERRKVTHSFRPVGLLIDVRLVDLRLSAARFVNSCVQDGKLSYEMLIAAVAL